MSLITPDQYFKRLEVNEIAAICPSEVSRDYEECPTEWYHLLANESVFSFLASNRKLKMVHYLSVSFRIERRQHHSRTHTRLSSFYR